MILPGDSSVLHLIDLDQDLPGQRRFISCWVSLGEDLVFIVDPGPPSTADHLISRLEELGVRIHCEQPVSGIMADDDQIKGLQFDNAPDYECDRVVSTIPLSALSKLLPEAWRHRG